MIRRATVDDSDQLLTLLAMRHSENGPALGRFDEYNARAKVVEMSRPRGLGVIGVIEVGGKIVATIGLQVGRFWDTNQPHLEDVWIFVHPDHRRTNYLKRLIAYAKSASRESGLRLVMAQADSQTRIAQVLGSHFVRVGTVFTFDPEVAHA